MTGSESERAKSWISYNSLWDRLRWVGRRCDGQELTHLYGQELQTLADHGDLNDGDEKLYLDGKRGVENYEHSKGLPALPQASLENGDEVIGMKGVAHKAHPTILN